MKPTSSEAALNSLRRPQLQKLCVKYGLKGSGKNIEMIARLQEFGATLPPRCHLFVGDDSDNENQDLDEDMDVDEDISEIPSSPHRHYHHDPHPQSPSSPATIPRPPSPLQPSYSDSLAIGYPLKRSLPIIHPHNPAHNKGQGRGKQSRDSEWEMLTEGQTSLVIHPKEVGFGKLGVLDESGDHENGTGGSTKSWKSARNGGRLDDFGSRTAGVFDSVRRTSGSLSHKASIKRLTSSLSLKRSFNRPSIPLSPLRVPAAEDNPPSPAPKVGVVTRHRNQLGRGPSTIRLVGSQEMLGETVGEGVGVGAGGWEGDETLPLWGGMEMAPQKEKEREVLMDVETTETHRPITSIYPPLTKLNPPLPGSFPTSTSAPAFIFGSQTGGGVSDEQFGEAAKPVLEAMNRKLEVKGVRGIGESGAGAGGGGAGGAGMPRGGRTGRGGRGGGGDGRFDEPHSKEFAKMDSIASHYAAKRMPSSNNLATSTSNSQPRTANKRKPSPGPPSITASFGSSIAVLNSGEREYVESPRGKRMRADESGRGVVTAGEGVERSRVRPWGGSKLVAGSRAATRGSRTLASGTETAAPKSAGLNIFASSANALKRTFAALGRPSGSPRRPAAASTTPASRPPVPAPAYKKPLPPVPSILPSRKAADKAMDFEPQVARSKSTTGLSQLKKAAAAPTLAPGKETGSLSSRIVSETDNHPYNLPRPHSDLDLARSLRYAKSSSHLPQPPKRDVATTAAGLRKRSRPAPPPPMFEGKASTAPLAILTPGQRPAAVTLAPRVIATSSSLYAPTVASLARMQPAAREMTLSGDQGANTMTSASSKARLNKTPAGKRRLVQKTPSTSRAGYGGTPTRLRHLYSPIRARTSNADLAMAMKHQELMERKKKTLEERRLVNELMGRGEGGLNVDGVLGKK